MTKLEELKAKLGAATHIADDFGAKFHEARCVQREAEAAYSKELMHVCPHEKTKIVYQNYSEGRTGSQRVEWKERVCIACGKVLAHTSTKEVWSDR